MRKQMKDLQLSEVVSVVVEVNRVMQLNTIRDVLLNYVKKSREKRIRE